jgi:hypothetical protein
MHGTDASKRLMQISAEELYHVRHCPSRLSSGRRPALTHTAALTPSPIQLTAPPRAAAQSTPRAPRPRAVLPCARLCVHEGSARPPHATPVRALRSQVTRHASSETCVAL